MAETAGSSEAGHRIYEKSGLQCDVRGDLLLGRLGARGRQLPVGLAGRDPRFLARKRDLRIPGHPFRRAAGLAGAEVSRGAAGLGGPPPQLVRGTP
ncbi:hypothetical protein D1872_282210 [compost metagenome]